MTIYWVVFSLFALVSCLGLLYLQGLLARQERELVSLRRELRTLTSNLSAQCVSSGGMNLRLNRLEGGLRQFQEQLERREVEQRLTEQPYGEAIHLVHQGAGAQRLVDELGLSRTEADLIHRVHGIRAAA
jgi:hypothetical protein